MKKHNVYLSLYYSTVILIVILLWACNRNNPLGTKSHDTLPEDSLVGNDNYDLRTDTFTVYNYYTDPGAELRVKNSTRELTNGLLTNIDSGLTTFRKLDLVNIADTAIGIVGQDTIDYKGLPKSYVDNVPIIFAGSGGVTNLIASQSRTVFVANRTGTSTFYLPVPVPGLIYTFTSNTPYVMNVSATAATFIKGVNNQTTAGGSLSSTAVYGSSITIVAITTNTWIVLSYTGTWTAS